jgi:hypothetical protein
VSRPSPGDNMIPNEGIVACLGDGDVDNLDGVWDSRCGLLHIKITHYDDGLVLSLPMSQVLHFVFKKQIACKCRKYHTVILPMSCINEIIKNT